MSPPQSRLGRSLRFNFGWTLAGNVTYGGCQWLMLVCIARLGDPGMLGNFVLAQAIAAPVVLFSNLQLRVIQATDSNGRFEFGHYLALRYITTLATVLGIAVWGLAGKYRSESLAVLMTVTLAKSIESLSDVYFGLLQRHEEMSRIAKSMIVKGCLSVVALSVSLYLTRRLLWGALAMMLTWLGVFVFYDRRASQLCGQLRHLPNWDYRSLIQLARLAFPLGVTMMLISLNGSLPRYFMEHFKGTRGLGLFSALATLQTAGMLVVMALGNAALPRLARFYQAADWPGFRNTVLLILAISIALGAMTIVPVLLGGDWLITRVFGREYSGQNQTFIWLALAASVSYFFAVFGYSATASHRIGFQPFAYAIVAAATVLGCYWLVPAYGGLGAAITMCAAAVLGGALYVLSFAGTARELRARWEERERRCHSVSAQELGLSHVAAASALLDSGRLNDRLSVS